MHLEGQLAAAAAAVALVLVSAKTHGRLVRLEREAAGFFEVDFMADNAPEVEALWARDRRTFWRTFAVFAVALLALAWLLPWMQPAWFRVGAPLVAAFAASFAVAGAGSQRRRGRPTRADAGWWAAVAAAWAVFLVLLAWA